MIASTYYLINKKWMMGLAFLDALLFIGILCIIIPAYRNNDLGETWHFGIWFGLLFGELYGVVRCVRNRTAA